MNQSIIRAMLSLEESGGIKPGSPPPCVSLDRNVTTLGGCESIME